MGVNGIYGLSSGLDVESLVTQAMSAKQSQYDSMYKKEKAAEWTKDAYNEWYQKLSDFQNNTLYKYALSSGMQPKTAATSNSNVVTATAGGSAAAISHQITVNSMSSNAYLKSTAEITRPTGVDKTSIKLADILGVTNIKLTSADGKTNQTDKLTYTVNGTNYELDGTAMDETALSFTIRDGGTTTNADTNIETKNTYTVSFSYRDLAEGTLNDLAAKINNSGTNINAQYDTANDSFSIYNKTGGNNNLIDITVDKIDLPDDLSSKGVVSSNENTRNLLGALQLGQYNATTDTLGSAISGTTFSDTPTDPANLNTAYSANAYSGIDGSVKIDGKTYTTNSNQLTVDGVTYNLVSQSPSTTTTVNGVTTTTYASSTVSVNPDIDTVIKNMKQFVDDYNTLLGSLKTAVNTEPDENYQPLTDDDKKAMSDDQVTAWEKKAKQGLLYKDSTLTDLISDMRSAVNQPISGISGQYNSLSNLGISVSADWTSENSGVLSLDEDKLRKALSADPDAAYKVLNNPAANQDDSSTQGVVKRLNTAMSAAIGTGSIETATGLRGMAGVTDSGNYADQSYWGKEITNWKDKMSDFQDAMDKYQDSLYSQFDAMETAIQNLNSQYSFVSSYLGS